MTGVMFSSPMSLVLPYILIIIWRERGTGNHPAFVQESVRFGGGGVMVWADISINGRADLHAIRNGSQTAQHYRSEFGVFSYSFSYSAIIRR
ncbi:hypothetical protein AVEN_172316-1 [Araneus ventricosus]|uniref:Uncharacterized protein n=1 Tax=Araneus ventricosus TaxID=182803 RepID=A0A4Y2E3S2_ARAVE|nr:hypothetical protein AVEN_172316-1 [Araneus ventricosus]